MWLFRSCALRQPVLDSKPFRLRTVEPCDNLFKQALGLVPLNTGWYEISGVPLLVDFGELAKA